MGERAGRAVRGDAHEARQHGVAVDQFLGDQRAEGRVLDLVLGQHAGVHQLGGPRVFAFLGGHRADDGHAVGELGDLRQVFAEADRLGRGLNFLEGAAVGVSRV